MPSSAPMITSDRAVFTPGARLRLIVIPLSSDVIPLLDFAANVIRDTFAELTVEVYPRVVAPPRTAYDPRRGQYISDVILDELYRLRLTLGVDFVLGIAGFDAYSDGLNFVFGEAAPGAAAVVYTPRLRPEFYGEPPNERLFLERLEKEVLHELGHVFGLSHCSNPRCVMRFSNSVWEVDEKKPMYCTRCASKLARAGFKVSPSRILEL